MIRTLFECSFQKQKSNLLSLDKRRIIVDFSNERQGVETMNRIMMASNWVVVDWSVDRSVVGRSMMATVDRAVVNAIHRRMNWIGMVQVVESI